MYYIIKVLNKDLIVLITCVLLIGLGYILGRHSLSEEQFIKIFSTLSSIIAVLIAYKALNTWKYSEQAKIRAVFVSKIYPQFLKYKKEIDYFAIGFENSDFCNLTDVEESKLACDYFYLIKEVYRLNDFLLAYEAEIILLGSNFFEEYTKYQSPWGVTHAMVACKLKGPNLDFTHLFNPRSCFNSTKVLKLKGVNFDSIHQNYGTPTCPSIMFLLNQSLSK